MDEKNNSTIDDRNGEVPPRRVWLCVAVFASWNIALSALHAFFPQRTDVVTVVLAEAAILPILVFLFRYLEVGFGDWRVKLFPNRVFRAFARLDELAVRVESCGEVEPVVKATVDSNLIPSLQTSRPSSLSSASKDMIVVRLSNEIMERLKKIASNRGLDSSMAPAPLLLELTRAGVVTANEADALQQLLAAGMVQRIGAPVPADIAELARNEGERLLTTLDRLALAPVGRIVDLVLQRAQKAGLKDARVANPVVLNQQLTFLAVIVPGKLIIAFRTAAVSKLAMSTALAELRNRLEREGISEGILMTLRPPTPENTEIAGGAIGTIKFGSAHRAAPLGPRFAGSHRIANRTLGDPVSFPSVVAVGGTTLTQGGGSRGWTEAVWPGSGAGCSTELKPKWQRDPGCKFRTTNDVAAVADPNTCPAEYDTYGYYGYDGRFVVGGKSVSSPLLAGVFGLAGNATSQHGGKTFWEKTTTRKTIFPIISGNDGNCSPRYVCTAGTREYHDYSGPGGWGTPNGIRAF